MNAELMDARKKMGKQQSSSLTKPNEFKRITIQEESDEEDEEDSKDEAKGVGAGNQGSNKLEQLVDDLLLEEQKKGVEGRIKQIEEIKLKANELSGGGKYDQAIKEYQKGMNILNDIKLSGAGADIEDDITNKKAVFLNNIAFCYMQMDLPDNVITYTSRIFDLDNVNSDTIIKAYIRRGKSLFT